jgi:CheY-like chemotaxis protein
MSSPPALPRLLYVDNNPDDLALVQRLLPKAGIEAELVVANGGEEAVAWLQRHAKRQDRPMIAIIDLGMPKLDGFDVLEWMLKQRALGTVTTVVLTDSDDPEDRTRATSLGADHYVVKDRQLASLVALLRDLLG